MADPVYTCPMHPEVRRPGPGSCPLCGMALEPLEPVAADEGDGAELRDMTRRFTVSAALSAPLLALAMGDMLPGRPISSRLPGSGRALLELGKTFREHVAELRLERAKSLLRETEMTVIEVAGETGWSSLAHFNSVFRRRVGSTPGQFRRSAVH